MKANKDSLIYIAAVIAGALGLIAVIAAYFWRRYLLEGDNTGDARSLSTFLPIILLIVGLCFIIWAIAVLIISPLRKREADDDAIDVPEPIVDTAPDPSLVAPPRLPAGQPKIEASSIKKPKDTE